MAISKITHPTSLTYFHAKCEDASTNFYEYDLAVTNSKHLVYTITSILFLLSFQAQATSHQQIEVPQSISNIASSQSLASIWIENQQLTYKAHDALDFIGSSARHGLIPNNYHYDKLNQLDPSQGESQAHLFSQLLTEGLQSLIHDLAIGRTDPLIADPDWHIPRTPFNSNVFLQQAIHSDNFKNSLNSIIPTSNEYQTLSQALNRYQSYVDRGGWGKIQDGPLLRPEASHASIPAIRARLAFEDELLVITANDDNTHLYDAALTEAVQRFQRRHHLKVDGIIGADTRQAMNVSAEQRLQQIKINLERIRWLPQNLGQRYVLINLTSYRLIAIDQGQKKLDMRVIVGQPKRQTPSFVSQMNHIIFNPYWNVPRKLARLDVLPKQQADPNYFYTHGFRVFNIDNGLKSEVDPYTIDWLSVSPQNFPFTLQQVPGDLNALGKMKFMFPNPWNIYLHDTPNRALFNETKRNLSSGCIRVEDPLGLMNFSLSRAEEQHSALEKLASQKNLGQKLTEPLSIYAVYFTVSSDGGEVFFSQDVYLRDQKMAKYL